MLIWHAGQVPITRQTMKIFIAKEK